MRIHRSSAQEFDQADDRASPDSTGHGPSGLELVQPDPFTSCASSLAGVCHEAQFRHHETSLPGRSSVTVQPLMDSVDLPPNPYGLALRIGDGIDYCALRDCIGGMD